MEMLIVVAIGLITTAIAVPLVQKATSEYQLKSAAASLASLIQSTRYQAISAGYQYEVVMTASSSTYQLAQDTTNSGTFANVGNTGLLWGSSVKATLGQDTTLVFRPSGLVIQTKGAAPVSGVNQITVSYGNLPQETISITNYGYVKVSP